MKYVNTSTLRLSPYNANRLHNGSLLAWPADMAEVRNNPAIQIIEWGVDNINLPPVFSCTRQEFLTVTTNKSGIIRQTQNSYYVEMPYSLLKQGVATLAQVPQTVKVKSKIPGVSFTIFSNNKDFKVRRHGKTKESLLAPTFTTVGDAQHYLVTQCSGVI